MEIFEIIDTKFHNGSSRYFISCKGNYELRDIISKFSYGSNNLKNNALKEENDFMDGCLKKRTFFINCRSGYYNL